MLRGTRGYSRVAMLEQLLITFGWRTRHIWGSEHRGVQEDTGMCGMCGMCGMYAEMFWVLCMQARFMQQRSSLSRAEQMRCTYWTTEGFRFFLPASHIWKESCDGSIGSFGFREIDSRSCSHRTWSQGSWSRSVKEGQEARVTCLQKRHVFRMCVCWPQIQSFQVTPSLWFEIDPSIEQNLQQIIGSWGQAKARSSLWSQLTRDIPMYG